jgi:hypothetical protein
MAFVDGAVMLVPSQHEGAQVAEAIGATEDAGSGPGTRSRPVTLYRATPS